MKEKNIVKIQTYCPENSADAVRMAIGDAGGGIIGNYSHCAFVSSGYGYFKPLKGSDPTIGKQGEIERVDEVKIEFVCEKDKVQSIIDAIRKSHPYEEVPIEIFPMLIPEG